MIYTNSDGGSRGNPGPGAIGIIIRNDSTILMKYSQFIGREATNNIAEYEALIKALELASKIDKEVTCILDSELIVNQLLGKYKVRSPILLKLFLKVQKAQDKFDRVKYEYVSRWNKFQMLADELVNQELDNNGFKRYGRN